MYVVVHQCLLYLASRTQASASARTHTHTNKQSHKINHILSFELMYYRSGLFRFEIIHVAAMNNADVLNLLNTFGKVL